MKNQNFFHRKHSKQSTRRAPVFARALVFPRFSLPFAFYLSVQASRRRGEKWLQLFNKTRGSGVGVVKPREIMNEIVLFPSPFVFYVSEHAWKTQFEYLNRTRLNARAIHSPASE